MAPIWQCYVTPALLALMVYWEVIRYGDVLFSLTPASVVTYFQSKIVDAFQLNTIWIVPAYLLFYLVGSILLPGFYHKGAPLRNGDRPVYKLNGIILLVIGLGLFALAGHYGLVSPTLFYDHYSSVFVQCNVIAIAFSVYLYLRGRATGGTGNFLHDFWMGTELMPYSLGLPLKLFWLKPSMTLWLYINYSFLMKQLQLYSAISQPMMLYQIFTLIYVLDYFILEHYMTSTWDIIAENFGMMLVWGDFVWIPFVFSLQCWFLLNNFTVFGTQWVSVISAVFVIGFIIFRGSNYQKHNFKHHPSGNIWGKPPVTIGGKLLCSGWWGLSRHINYLGDVILGVSYSLPCYGQGLLPWLYPIYLSLLLVHREARDEHKCAEKYGKQWKEYTTRVPYRIIPWLY